MRKKPPPEVTSGLFLRTERRVLSERPVPKIRGGGSAGDERVVLVTRHFGQRRVGGEIVIEPVPGSKKKRGRG